MFRLTAGLAAAATLSTAALTAAPARAADDLQPPTIYINGPTAGLVDGWSAAGFYVTVRATDTGGSGLAETDYEVTGATTASGTLQGTTPVNILVDASGRTTFTVHATDRAGNESTASADFGVDRSQPSVALGANLNGLNQNSVPLGAEVIADYECQDADSGIDSCTAPVAVGQPVDTSTPGPHSLAITARDKVGRNTTSIVSWTVEQGAFTLASPLGYDHVPAVGETVQALPPQLSPTPESLSYQWLRDGEPISGATGTSYTTTVADAGTVIAYEVRPHKTGYADGPFAATAVRVLNPGVDLDGNVKVHGTWEVGSEIFSEITGGFDPADAQVSFRWLRDGTPIPGATGESYVLTAADLGKTLVLRVTAESPGHAPFVAERSTLEIQPGRLAPLGETSISGIPRVGQVLSADTPTYPATATTTYQWLRNGSPIAGATRATYRLAEADAGARIAVRIAVHAPGYLDHSAVSLATSTVVRTSASIAASAKAKAGRKVAFTVTVRAPGVVPTGVVRVRRGTRYVGAARVLAGGVVRFTLAKQPKGKQTYVLEYGGSAGVTATSAKVRVRVR
jgi:hypothetical protein